MHRNDVVNNFTYHPPTPEQTSLYDMLRKNALTFALIIKDYTPSSPEQTIALRKLEECVMYANAAIAREPTRPVTPKLPPNPFFVPPPEDINPV